MPRKRSIRRRSVGMSGRAITVQQRNVSPHWVDILHDRGAAWREANRGHLSLERLKVMNAIERRRTAALSGYVARCENTACGHTLIACNSCRNRKCPKCQAAASRRWLANREAELLPVQYFHVVQTLAERAARHLLPEQARGLLTC